jgi:hypothetical protein
MAMARFVLPILWTLFQEASAYQLAQKASATVSAALELQVAENSGRKELANAALILNGLADDLTLLQRSLRRAGVESFMQLESAPAHAHKKDVDVRSAVKQMEKLGPKQMPAMVTLLKGMYDTWKDKITQENKYEQAQKRTFDKTIKELEDKKRKFKADANATQTYDNIEKYWKRQRENAHHQYHTALKIMHAGMEKFKAVESAMQNAVDGKKPSANELRSLGMLMPDVVLLQRQVSSLRAWVNDAAKRIADA